VAVFQRDFALLDLSLQTQKSLSALCRIEPIKLLFQ
jgi:hypothetical protein